MTIASLVILVGLFIATIRVSRIATRIESTQQRLDRDVATVRVVAEMVPNHSIRIAHLEDLWRLSRADTGNHPTVSEAE